MAKCNNCKDTGFIHNDTLGINVKCMCKIAPENKSNEPIKKPTYHVTKAQYPSIVAKGLINSERIEDEYLEDKLVARVEAMACEQRCSIKGFAKYTEALSDIIAGISTSTLRKSYIIGAPNGFSKTTFVNTCIKRLDAMGLKAVPFISLFEIAELRAERERFLLGYISKTSDKNTDAEDRVVKYNWNDYINADVLFTFLTTLESKKIETAILKSLMDIRGNKCLPTIVLTSSSLNPYLADSTQKKVIWDDILSYNDEVSGCDRLIHRSCFKVYDSNVNIAANGR